MSDPQPVLKALADPTRRTMFERLNEQGPASASRLAEELPVSRQAIAKHLSLLLSAGLVERSEQGREVVFSASTEPLTEIDQWLKTVGSAWGTRLARLKDQLE